MSIQPQWIDLIDKGYKTVEIRKTRPKDFVSGTTVYVYCTGAPKKLHDVMRDGDEDFCGDTYHGKTVFFKYADPLPDSVWGKEHRIVGQFTVNAIETLNNLFEGEPVYHMPTIGECCLGYKELLKYGKGKRLYAWGISDWKMYDIPLEIYGFYGLMRPPQSWQYLDDYPEWHYAGEDE